MCQRPPEMSCAQKFKFHAHCTRNRIVKRPKFEPVVAVWKLTKLPFFPKKSTKIDFLAPKSAQDPLKPPVPKNSRSMPRAHDFGMSWGPNLSLWWPFENWRYCHFFNNFCIFDLQIVSYCVFNPTKAPKNVIFTSTPLVEPLKCPYELIKCVKKHKI